MKTLIIDKSNGQILSVWNGVTPVGYRVDYCNYVDIPDDHELIKQDEDGLPIPAAEHYPRWNEEMSETSLKAMTKAEIQYLADARGYTGIDRNKQTEAEMITAFLEQQG